MNEIMNQIRDAISRSDSEAIKNLLSDLQPELDRRIREESPFNGLYCFIPKGGIYFETSSFCSYMTVWLDFDRSLRPISGNVFEEAVEDASDFLNSILPCCRQLGDPQYISIVANFIINPEMLEPYKVKYESEK